MFNFILDAKKFNKMVPFCGEYIDIIAYKGQVLLVSESGISYAHHVVDSSFIDDSEGISSTVRVQTEMFSRLAIDGLIQVDKFEESSTISFFGVNSRKARYSITIGNQLSMAKYMEILNLVYERHDYDTLDLSNCVDIIALSSRLNTDILSLDGLIYLYVKSSYIYKKEKLVPFSCIGKDLYKAVKLSTRPFHIAKYLLFCDTENEVYVALERNRAPKGNSLDKIVGKGSKYKFELDLSNLVSVMKSVKSAEYDITIDLMMEDSIVTTPNSTFNIHTPSSRIESAKDKRMSFTERLNNPDFRQIFKLKLPYWLIPIVGNGKNLELYPKGTCSVIKTGDISVVFGGTLLDG